MGPSFDPGGADADLALDVFAAQLRLQHQDAAQQAERIAARVTQLVPHLCDRQDRSGWPFGRPALKRLRVRLGSEHLELLVDGRQVHYRAVHHVGGIDLSHHDLQQDDWIRRLMAGMAEQSRHTEPGESSRLF